MRLGVPLLTIAVLGGCSSGTFRVVDAGPDAGVDAAGGGGAGGTGGAGAAAGTGGVGGEGGAGACSGAGDRCQGGECCGDLLCRQGRCEVAFCGESGLQCSRDLPCCSAFFCDRGFCRCGEASDPCGDTRPCCEPSACLGGVCSR